MPNRSLVNRKKASAGSGKILRAGRLQICVDAVGELAFVFSSARRRSLALPRGIEPLFQPWENCIAHIGERRRTRI